VYTLSDFVNSKLVKTKKIHRCGFCGRIIPKNTIVTYNSGRFEGEFFRSYLDGFCETYLEINRADYADYGYNEDCFGEIDTWFVYNMCGCVNHMVTMAGNDIKNKKILFECVNCEKETWLPWEEALKIIRRED
jgi:hypothetical protein